MRKKCCGALQKGRGSASPQSAPPTHSTICEYFSVYNFETVVPPKFVTHMLAPSKATPAGSFPTVKVLSVAPVLAFNWVTVPPTTASLLSRLHWQVSV